MKIKKVEFSEEEKSLIINMVFETAISESKCYEEKNGWTLIFENVVNSGLTMFATVLINDESNSRYASTDIKILHNYETVESNLNYSFEDSINKALINEFHKIY